MTTTDIATVVGLAALIIATQWGRHAVTPRRFILPVLLVGFAAYHYLNGIPTAGGDLDMDVLFTAAGAGLGVLAGGLIRVERDGAGGRIMMQAGLAYAALWAIVFGGRLAFAWAATHTWQHAVAQFSIQHAITGGAAWTAAFILMALAMVLTRTAVLAARTLSLRGNLTGAQTPA
jgi:hypothetical protein